MTSYSLLSKRRFDGGLEDLIPAGIVLTGGTSRMEGAVELAEEIFHMPVRVGYPQSISGLKDILRNPIYSTGVGLLHYGAENFDNYHSSLHTQVAFQDL